MKKNKARDHCVSLFGKTVRIMKITTFLLTAAVWSLAASTYAQSFKISLRKQQVPVIDVLKEVEKSSEFTFFFNDNQVDVRKKVDIQVEDATLDQVMARLFDPEEYTYRVIDRQVVIRKRNDAGHQQKEPQPIRRTIEITGIVFDEAGEPVIGANIMEKGTVNGVVTDREGKFAIQVPSGAELTVSYIGYVTVSLKVGSRKQLTVRLKENTQAIEEVVVVGYGTQKKESLTGAISHIRNKEILTTTNSSLAQNLAGKISGLRIRQNSGEPGDFNSMINIRGFGDPLYIIDGVPQDLGGTDFQRLNPQDIESISVIKDASAAIYGLRAGNGVVIVTTNRGEKGKTRFDYDVVFGWQRPTDMPRMANRSEWAQMRNEANLNAGSTPFFTREELAAEMTGASTDWYGLTMRNFSTQQQHNLSASGGTDRVSYFASLGYVRDDGLLRSGDLHYDKYTFRSNVSMQLTKYFKGEVNVSGRYDTKMSPSQGFHNIFYGTRTALPDSPAYANDNSDYPAYQRFLNPVVISQSDLSGYAQNKNRQLSSSLSLTYEVPFVKGLSLKGLGSYIYNHIQDKVLSKEYKLYTYDEQAENPYRPVRKNSPSKITQTDNNIDMLTLQAHLLYSARIARDHRLGVTLVYEMHKYSGRLSSLAREYSFFTNDQIDQAGLNNQTNSGMEEQRVSSSWIGRFNYDYQGKYLLEYAFRYDGSYRYHPDKRWGFFPVVSAGWRISEERFMKRAGWLSNLKLRASYGSVGEDAGSPFQYVTGYSLTGGGGYEFVDGTWTDGAASPSLVNERLTWYTSRIKDVGIDLGLFNNRFTFEFDLYQRDRKGLLSTRVVSLPNTFGGELPEENLNSDRVRGFDFSAAYTDRIGDWEFGIRGNFNLARTMNRYVERGPFLNSMDHWRNGTSDRWNDIQWGYVLDGQFSDTETIIYAPIQNGQQGNTLALPGDYKYKDVNEDGIIDDRDMVPMFYNGTPKLFYGFSLNLAYKGFDFNAQFQGAARYTVRFKEVYAEMLAFDLNTPAYFFDRWHRADPYDTNSAWIPGKWPATRLVTDAGTTYLESEVWRKDASYLRLKSVELGYTLPSEWLKPVGIEGVRMYFTAHNVFTITDSFVRPFDPEKLEGTNSSGFTYPLMRSFNLGLNIHF